VIPIYRLLLFSIYLYSIVQTVGRATRAECSSMCYKCHCTISFGLISISTLKRMKLREKLGTLFCRSSVRPPPSLLVQPSICDMVFHFCPRACSPRFPPPPHTASPPAPPPSPAHLLHCCRPRPPSASPPSILPRRHPLLHPLLPASLPPSPPLRVVDGVFWYTKHVHYTLVWI
jgi:hypothetical protein